MVQPVGAVIATYKKVPAYQNGAIVTRSHSRYYAHDGYYYGQKWQCNKYIKRFYHAAKTTTCPASGERTKDF